MGAIAVNTLISRVQRAVGDFRTAAFDICSVSTATTDAYITPTNVANFQTGRSIVIDQEELFVTAVNASTIAVTRGWNGSSAQSHASGAAILFAPEYGPQDYLDALNEGQRMLFPYFFKRVVDNTLSITGVQQADYAMPSVFGEMGRVTTMKILEPGLKNDGWRTYRRFETVRGASGTTLHFTGPVPYLGTQIQLEGIAAFDTDLTVGGTTDAEMIDRAATAMVIYAQHFLLLQSEARRNRQATSKNTQPNATAPGAQSNLANVHLQRFEAYCQVHAQPWPPMYTRRRY